MIAPESLEWWRLFVESSKTITYFMLNKLVNILLNISFYDIVFSTLLESKEE